MTKEEAKQRLLNTAWLGSNEDRDKTEEAVRVLITALEQEPCEDCISRKDIQDYIAKYLSQYLYNDVREAIEDIDAYIGDLPSVQPKTEQEPKVGHWIDGDRTKWKCSNCGYGVLDWNNTPYCPNCGAKMESEDKE